GSNRNGGRGAARPPRARSPPQAHPRGFRGPGEPGRHRQGPSGARDRAGSSPLRRLSKGGRGSILGASENEDRARPRGHRGSKGRDRFSESSAERGEGNPREDGG